ncbi:metal ABC transporter ATPase [Cyanobacterium aponinum FACHB-4101]|uniref:Metal ABC transporter ATPase n=1 Tax=Cyanobacterium aponinum 0216 TaxID=2676140 RepID=A0A844GW67_9CHRO|nr:metal ABC transporter ATPase [Cyanobacterium aponinum]MBD2394944.1 metal ABC transporter ATPase [Cyanobacterium aponinum FACHB-4101]MTF39292.1 metal ABC transporter ATPase [Cyanobacterium aponinum 0216]PHV61233.1 metal ABC transporter ATPase [Cyanobacterium aponinum IPPAS B-1201]
MTNATVTAENSAITTTENKEQIATFLKEHEEVEMIIPVMFGLFVTSQFQLRGAKALLVNLGVATVFRQLFKELKKSPSQDTQSSTTQNQTNVSEDEEEMSILHSVKGRVRLRIPQIKKDALFAKRLERLLNDDDNVLNVRMNRTVSSVVIKYDAGNLSDMDLGFKLMSIIDAAKGE